MEETWKWLWIEPNANICIIYSRVICDDFCVSWSSTVWKPTHSTSELPLTPSAKASSQCNITARVCSPSFIQPVSPASIHHPSIVSVEGCSHFLPPSLPFLLTLGQLTFSLLIGVGLRGSTELRFSARSGAGGVAKGHTRVTACTDGATGRVWCWI